MEKYELKYSIQITNKFEAIKNNNNQFELVSENINFRYALVLSS